MNLRAFYAADGLKSEGKTIATEMEFAFNGRLFVIVISIKSCGV